MLSPRSPAGPRAPRREQHDLVAGLLGVAEAADRGPVVRAGAIGGAQHDAGGRPVELGHEVAARGMRGSRHANASRCAHSVTKNRTGSDELGELGVVRVAE